MLATTCTFFHLCWGFTKACYLFNMHHHIVIHVMFVGHLCIGIREFSPAEVLAATGNFGDLVGKGGFGKVFKGKYHHSYIAVKVLNKVNLLKCGNCVVLHIPLSLCCRR